MTAEREVLWCLKSGHVEALTVPGPESPVLLPIRQVRSVVVRQIRLPAVMLMEKLLQWLLVVVVVVLLRQLWQMLRMQVLVLLLLREALRRLRHQVRRGVELLQLHMIRRQRRAMRKWASCSVPCMIPSLVQILKPILVIHVAILAPIRVHCETIHTHSRYVVLRHARSIYSLMVLEGRLSLMMLSEESLLPLQGRPLLQGRLMQWKESSILLEESRTILVQWDERSILLEESSILLAILLEEPASSSTSDYMFRTHNSAPWYVLLIYLHRALVVRKLHKILKSQRLAHAVLSGTKT